MNIKTILTMALSAGTLLAQQPDSRLDARIQLFGEVTRPAQFTLAQVGGSDIKDQAKSQTGVGLRFMGELTSAPGWYYEVGGKLDSSSNLTLNGPLPGGAVLNATDVKITHSYWSLGAAYLFSKGDFSLGLHLEARGEVMRAQGEVDYIQGGITTASALDQASNYLRPWVRVSADYTLGGGRIRPFLGVDAAYAITRTTQTRVVPASQMDERTLRSMAPDASASFYLGLRF